MSTKKTPKKRERTPYIYPPEVFLKAREYHEKGLSLGEIVKLLGLKYRQQAKRLIEYPIEKALEKGKKK